VAHASDGRGPKTSLTAAALEYFNVANPDDLSTAIYAPTMTNDRLAGFGREVMTAAQDDHVAVDILTEAGRELGRAATAVIKKLRMENEKFTVAYVGGVYGSGEMVLDPMREEIGRVAKFAHLSPPLFPPVVAAARMAHAHMRSELSLAV
jgi:N-acetylglucosamine kinase-like BadF-type ATPase